MASKKAQWDENDISIWEEDRSSTLIGHSGTIQEINQMLVQGRLPHGFIFQGPWGIGKSKFAFHLAASLLKNTSQFCAHLDVHDPIYRQMRVLSHPDYLCLDGLSAGVEDVRALMQFFQQTASMAGWRVAILDNVHGFSVKAATTILKLLEEPPEKCLLILTTPHIDQVPATLRSRCQVLNFGPLKSIEGAKVLMEVNPGIMLDEATQLMEAGKGSPGYALALKDFGGSSFVTSFEKAFEEVSRVGIGPVMELLDPLLFKSKDLDPDQSWRLMVEFLQDFTYTWIKSQLVQGSLTKPLPEIWFENSKLFQTGSIFNLDRRQMLVLCLSQLTHTP